jgi:hypothetical protein
MAAADAHPLASLAEFIRRMKGCRLGDILAVHILDDDTENVYIDGFFPTSSTNVDSGQEGTLMFLGKPTVIGSGTLSAVVAQSGNTRGTVTDSGLTSSWTAGCTSAADHAGCISTKLRGRMIRNTGGTKHAWMLADLGSKTAQIATPTDTFEGIDQQTSCVRSEFIVGDQYEIITFPRLAYLRIAPNIYTRVQTLTIGGDGIISTAVRPPLGSQILAALTWFTFTSSLGGSISELNCGNSGMTFTGSPLFTNSTFFDDRTGGAYFNGAEVTVGGFNTVYKSFLQFMSRATMTNTENGADSEFGFWDCQDSAITLEFNADIRLDVLSGSGNLGSILNFYNEGTRACAVSSPFTSWTATGSGKPVQFGSAVKYDYNELPVRDDSLGKVVCGVPTF